MHQERGREKKTILYFFEVLVPYSSHIVMSRLQVIKVLDSMAFTGGVYGPHSHWGVETTSHSAQEVVEVSDLSVVDHHALGLNILGSVPVQVDLLGCLSLIQGHGIGHSTSLMCSI